MNIKGLHTSKHPNVRIDKSLEKYKGKVIFKDKLEEANKTIKAVGLPKLKKKN